MKRRRTVPGRTTGKDGRKETPAECGRGRRERRRLPRLMPPALCLVPTGVEGKDHAPKPEPPGGLPAPPQMPLPEIPQPWLVSEPRVRGRCQPDSGRKRVGAPLGAAGLPAKAEWEAGGAASLRRLLFLP